MLTVDVKKKATESEGLRSRERGRERSRVALCPDEMRPRWGSVRKERGNEWKSKRMKKLVCRRGWWERAEGYWSGSNPTGSARQRAEGREGKIYDFHVGKGDEGKVKRNGRACLICVHSRNEDSTPTRQKS